MTEFLNSEEFHWSKYLEEKSLRTGPVLREGPLHPCWWLFYEHNYKRKGTALFNDALNTFYLWLYGIGHMVKDHSDSERGTSCRHMGYYFRLTARVLLYAPSHRQDCTYHSLCYTSRGALAGTRNSSMGPPHEGSIRRHIAP